MDAAKAATTAESEKAEGKSRLSGRDVEKPCQGRRASAEKLENRPLEPTIVFVAAAQPLTSLPLTSLPLTLA